MHAVIRSYDSRDPKGKHTDGQVQVLRRLGRQEHYDDSRPCLLLNTPNELLRTFGNVSTMIEMREAIPSMANEKAVGPN